MIRIGSRGSALALWQAEHVKSRLEDLGREVTIQVITTTGDRLLNRRLEAVGGKGAFLKEIEEGLQGGEVDLAVHSARSSSGRTRAMRCSRPVLASRSWRRGRGSAPPACAGSRR